jgi:lipopolysaccharide-induced tumor necrosis factor-alpha factor
MIVFACPHCNTKLSAPPGSEGSHCDCPTCGRRLDIPGDGPPRQRPASRPSESGGAGRVWREREDEDRPGRRGPADDYEEGPLRPRSRREDDEDEDRPGGGRRRRFRCPYCDSDEPPRVKSDISQAGWIVFALMVMFCLPLCFIGLLMKEEHEVCRDCGRQLS